MYVFLIPNMEKKRQTFVSGNPEIQFSKVIKQFCCCHIFCLALDEQSLKVCENFRHKTRDGRLVGEVRRRGTGGKFKQGPFYLNSQCASVLI